MADSVKEGECAMKKKWIAFGIAVLLLLFSSCTGQKEEEPQEQTTADRIVTTEPAEKETGAGTETQTQDASDGWTKLY